jgi:hypothetical protein
MLDTHLWQAQIRKLMPDWKKTVTIAKLIAEICGGWWTLMSGAISIPFAFLAILLGGKAGT